MSCIYSQSCTQKCMNTLQILLRNSENWVCMYNFFGHPAIPKICLDLLYIHISDSFMILCTCTLRWSTKYISRQFSIIYPFCNLKYFKFFNFNTYMKLSKTVQLFLVMLLIFRYKKKKRRRKRKPNTRLYSLW